MKKKLSLYKLTEELLDTSEKLVTALTEFVPVELERRRKMDKLQLTSKRAASPDRITESDLLILDDPIEELYQDKKTELKALYIHFDGLKSAVKSLQSLSYSGGGEL